MTLTKELSLFDMLYQKQVVEEPTLKKGMIRLDEYYTLGHDNLSWTLYYRREAIRQDKDGNDKTIASTEQTYHSSLKMALTKYVDSSVKVCNDVREMFDKYLELEERINNLFN